MDKKTHSQKQSNSYGSKPHPKNFNTYGSKNVVNDPVSSSAMDQKHNQNQSNSYGSKRNQRISISMDLKT